MATGFDEEKREKKKSFCFAVVQSESVIHALMSAVHSRSSSVRLSISLSNKTSALLPSFDGGKGGTWGVGRREEGGGSGSGGRRGVIVCSLSSIHKHRFCRLAPQDTPTHYKGRSQNVE